MHTLSKKVLAAAALLAAGVQAHAATEQFSYRFVDGELLTGTFTGQADGSGFSDIGNVHAWFNGVAIDGGAALHGGVHLPDGSVAAGAPRIDAQFTGNNFFFSNQSNPDSAAIHEEITFSTGADGVTVIGYSNLAASTTSDAFLNDAADTSYSTGPNFFKLATGLKPQWQLSPAPAVPEPSEALMLALGLGTLLFSLKSRR